MITWKLKYNLIHVKEKIATVTGIATDSDNPDNPVTVDSIALLANADGQKKAMDGLWQAYKGKLAKQTLKDTCLDGLVESGQEDLDARQL